MDRENIAKHGRITQLGVFLGVLAVLYGLSGCAGYQVTRQTDIKTMKNLSENEKILKVFNIDEQLLLEAIGKISFLDADGSIFNSGKLLNNYLDENKMFDEEGFKRYVGKYCDKNQWIMDKWWDEVMLNYNLLKKMEGQDNGKNNKKDN